MSLIKSNAIQIGQSLTPTQNFVWYQPTVPDGTLRVAVGNFGATTDIMTVSNDGSVNFAGAATFQGGVDLGTVDIIGSSVGGGTLKIFEDTDNGTNYVALKAPDSVASNITFTLPAVDGSAGQALTTNGSGTLSWAAAGATITDDTSTDASYYPSLETSTSGSSTAVKVSSTKLYFNPSTGTLNATTFNSLSDVAMKTNINPVTNAVGVINSIEGVEFDWKDNQEKSAGVIAQQLEQILPHLVATNKDGTKSVNYAGLTAYLIEAIKELSAKIK